MTIKNIFTPFILAADIGGSHITAGICHYKENAVINDSLVRVEVDCKGSAEDILNSWSHALNQVAEKAKVHISGVALAMPGPFDYDEGISFIKGLDKFESIYGINVKKNISEKLQVHQKLIKFRNDAEASILGECIAGSGLGSDRVVGITLGTGFGSAIYKNKTITDLNWGSSDFLDSIADDYFSTRWFVKRYRDITGDSILNVKQLVYQVKDETLIKMIFDEFTRNLVLFIKSRLVSLQSQCLVVCGNIAMASHLFMPLLKQELEGISVKIASLGEHSAIIGAANLFGNERKLG